MNDLQLLMTNATHFMKANPQILFITDSLSNGGAERQLVLLLKYLPKDWQAKLWSLDNGIFLQGIKEMGIPTSVVRRRFRYDMTPFLRLWKRIQSERPDCIHTWGWLSALAAAPICIALKIPLVDSAIRSGMQMPRARQIASRWADIVIANSQAGMRSSGIAPKRVRVIHNGFDPERLKLCPVPRVNSSACTTVVMTGRMVREKDFASFLAGARALHTKDAHSWRFLAIGQGSERESLISSAKDLIDNDCLSFPDAGLEVLSYVRQANIGVLLTNARYHAEGLSNSIMEYMACGLPVICNKNGGNQELVLDGKTGFLIDPGDTDQLVKQLTYLRQNPEIAHQMGMCGRERLIRYFSIENMVNNFISVYQEILRTR